MTLEQQVTSLEISKRLKELGVNQESLYHWTYATAWSKSTDGGKSPGKGNDYVEAGRPHITQPAAFTVAELGEMTKHMNDNISGYIGMMPIPVGGKWIWSMTHNYPAYKIECDTEADARGRMMIYLLENKLI